jgi:hypothetical protein
MDEENHHIKNLLKKSNSFKEEMNTIISHFIILEQQAIYSDLSKID